MKNVESVVISDFEVKCFADVEHAVTNIVNYSIDNSDIAVAINPEKIMLSMSDPNIKASIELASLRYIDGMGVAKVASSKLNKPVGRVPGCELWEALMKRSGQDELPVYLLGAKSDVLTKTVEKLVNDYQVNIVGYHDGFFDDEDKLIEEIKKTRPKILTVALGSPKQELFMSKCKAAGLHCFMMGVGGTYNVYTGSVKRAPKFWRKFGLEWLYRLLCEPTRIMRQLKLFKFMYLFLRNKL